MTRTETAVADFLDGMQQGVSLGVLIKALPDHDVQDIKDATRQLYEDRAINRLSVKGDNDKFYYVFYSLYIRTVSIYRGESGPAPTQFPALESIPVAEPIHFPAKAPAPTPGGRPLITIEEAEDVLRQAGWLPESEVEVERRVINTGVPRLDAMAVIDRWNLSYRLSRIIEIIGGARKRSLTADDAAQVSRLIRQHVKGEA